MIIQKKYGLKRCKHYLKRRRLVDCWLARDARHAQLVQVRSMDFLLQICVNRIK
jgi:hypothetical protein